MNTRMLMHVHVGVPCSCMCDQASADVSMHGPVVCVFALIVNFSHLLAQNHSAVKAFVSTIYL